MSPVFTLAFLLQLLLGAIAGPAIAALRQKVASLNMASLESSANAASVMSTVTEPSRPAHPTGNVVSHTTTFITTQVLSNAPAATSMMEGGRGGNGGKDGGAPF
jgi:hypothetical protein